MTSADDRGAAAIADDTEHDDVVGAAAGVGRERTLAWLAVALVVAPLVVSAVHLIFIVAGDYVPFGDVASTELYIRDIGDHVLLIGPYSRDGWFHPGPAFFYLLFLPYRLLGSASINLPLGSLLINGVSVVALALLARRRGGLPLMLCTLVASALLLNGLGPEFLSTPWNPYLVVLPYGVLLFLAWSMLCGETWALPAGAFVMSYLAQTHIAYVVLAVPLFVAGAVGLVLVQRRSPQPSPEDDGASGDDDLDGAATTADPTARQQSVLRALLRPGLWTLGIFLVMWLPPVIEQFTHEPGNLGEVTEYFFVRDDDDQTHTLSDGWRVVSAQYGLTPEWLAGRSGTTYVAEPSYLYSPVVPVLLLPVAAAAVLLWRRGSQTARKLVGLWIGASCVGIVATARTIGPVYFYRQGWAWVLGMIGGLLVLWTAWQLAVERWGDSARRALVAAAVVVLAGMAVFNSASTRGAEALDQDGSWALSELGPAVRDWLPDREGEVVVNATSFGALGYSSGLRIDLERHGIMAKSAVGEDRQGRPRVYHEGDPVRAWLTVALDAEIPERAAEGDQLIAYAGRLSQEELAAAAERLEAVEAEFGDGELTAEERLERRAEVLPPDSAVAVFAAPDIGN